MYVSIVVEYTTAYILPHFIPCIHYTQQHHVLQELAGHCAATPDIPETLSDLETLNFLWALNKMLERGILSSGRVQSINAEEILLLRGGFAYFESWYEELAKDGLTLTATLSLNFLHSR